mgnify:CR=1 FL=1
MEQDTTSPRAVLVCTEGSLKGQRAPVGADGLMLGRGEHCDMIIKDTGVSREHARVLLHNDAVWVQDAGSRNGCFLNGRRLSRHHTLSPGDDLRIGEHRFTIELDDPFPADGSVSTFGAPRPDGLTDPSASPPPAAFSPRPAPGRVPMRGLAVLAVIIALGLLLWMFGGG